MSLVDLRRSVLPPARLASIPGLAVWEWDVVSNRLAWSDAQKQLYGVGGDPERGEIDFLNTVHPDDRTRVEAEIVAFLASGQAFDHRFRIVRPDGTVRHILDRGVIERGPDGAAERLFGINIDITAEIEASLVARRAESQREALTGLGETLRNLTDFAHVDVLGASIVGRSLDLIRCGFALASDGGKHAVIKRDWVRDASIRSGAGSYRASDYGHFLDPLLQGETVAIADLAADPRTSRVAAVWAEWDVRAVAFVPLLRNGELVAYMFLHSGQPRVWSIADLGFVKTVADRIWAAYEKSAAQRDALAVFNAVDQMIWIARPDGYHEHYNDRWYEFTGVEPGSTDGEMWNGMLHPDDQDRARARWQHSLRTGTPYEIEYRLRHRSGEYRWVLGRARPLSDLDGQIIRWYGTCTDIHDAKLKEAELRRATALLELIGNSTPDLIYAKDREGRIIHVNEAAARLHGRSRDDILGRTDRELWVSENEADAYVANDRRVLVDGETIEVDETHVGAHGVSRTFRSVKAPIRAPDGTVVGLVGHSSDVSEQRRQEERERLLTREVDHRAKNLLAVVLALVRMTRDDDPTKIRDKLLGRLMSLSRTHSLLSASRWEGASVRAMLEEELSPFLAAAQRVELDGVAISLSPPAAQALSMVLHELATNSAKYGALSVEGGALTVRWDKEAPTGAFSLEWSESGGPAVMPPSASAGFGSLLIRSIAERQLKGSVDYDWRPQGLCVRLFIPRLEQAAEEAER
ncbi:PAS domain-containing protein [Roseomonas sp. CCTCC AB2023176]|uniref:PAS domain-containing protein n=1 Tax=Roseomonas sp. CCTCC AB2023176 TaxID=3342640 RepID=UPI0035E1612D